MEVKQQEKEIETIKERTVILNLSDADCIRVAKLAGSHGISVEQLLENFIGDLVDGTYSNGSAEHMYANQYFGSCWFGMYPEKTFLKYLVDNNSVEDFIENYGLLDAHEKHIEYYEEKIGLYEDRECGGYELRILEDNLVYLEGIQEEADFHRGKLQDYYQEYAQIVDEPESYEDGVASVLKWWDDCSKFATGAQVRRD